MSMPWGVVHATFASGAWIGAWRRDGARPWRGSQVDAERAAADAQRDFGGPASVFVATPLLDEPEAHAGREGEAVMFAITVADTPSEDGYRFAVVFPDMTYAAGQRATMAEAWTQIALEVSRFRSAGAKDAKDAAEHEPEGARADPCRAFRNRGGRPWLTSLSTAPIAVLRTWSAIVLHRGNRKAPVPTAKSAASSHVSAASASTTGPVVDRADASRRVSKSGRMTVDNRERARALKAKGEARLADCERRLLDESETEEQMMALLTAEFAAIRREALEEAVRVCESVMLERERVGMQTLDRGGPIVVHGMSAAVCADRIRALADAAP